MANQARSLDDLPPVNSVNANTILVVGVYANATANANVKSIPVKNFFGNVGANVIIQSGHYLQSPVLVISNTATPANSTITVAQGTMWFDENYLYVAVANNTLKRVALSSF